MKSLLLYLFVFCAALSAQDKFIAGISGSLIIPSGSLSQRFEPALGGAIYFGKEVSSQWTWTGNIEYFKLDKENRDKLFIKRKIEVGGEEKEFNAALPNLELELEAAGISANAEYKFLSLSLLDARFSFGFGVYRWYNFRSAYRDSVFSDTTGNGDLKLLEVLNVVSDSQVDWSGGFNAGLDLNFLLLDPFIINLSGRYKAILGELFPALSLDLENVSTFQMFEIKAGFRFRF